MIILLSPSKTLDFDSPTKIRYGSDPVFINDTAKLVKQLRNFRANELMELMNISYKLAELNYERYKEWTYPYKDEKVKPAFAAFMGDVYEGLKAWELDSHKIDLADRHVRILSGLYGILRPTDLILPYRLEMGIPIRGKSFENLYQFWEKKITELLLKEIKTLKTKVIINLASVEYAKAVNFNRLKFPIITPFFKEFKNGTYKFITLNGKKARGLMTRYILDKEITDPEELKLFNYEGYNYHEPESLKDRWVFVR